MPNWKSVGNLHVGDIVIYDNQRMRVAGFPNSKMATLVAMVLTAGRPSHQTVSVKDKKIHVVVQATDACKED